jgi:tetratricopeptide (TPR) repeat protein
MGGGIRVLAVVGCVSVATACSKPAATEHIQRGDDFKQRGMVQEAIIEYRNAVQIEPQRGDARLKLGDAYMEVRNAGGAYREYVRAADLLPKDVPAQIKAGNLLLLGGAFEDAQSRARQALEVEPSNTDALILLANAKAGLKDLDGALTQYQEAAALDPSDKVYSGMGTIQMARGEKADAEASFRKAVEVAPKSLPARLGLANFLWATQRLDEAEKELKAALEIDPKHVLANRALGTFYLVTKRTAEAEPHFKAIADADPSPEATMALSDYYVLTRRIDEARKVLENLGRDEKAWAQATTRLAALDAVEGYRAQGTDRVRSVLAKYPEDRPARLLLARLMLADGKREEALNEATTIVRDEPTSPVAADAYMMIGRIQAMLDRPDAAVKAYEEVLTRYKEPLGALIALASLQLSAGNIDKAASHVQQALVLQPKHPYSRALRVRVLLAQRKTAEARTELAALQKEYPNAPAVLNLLAAEQLATGQVAGARSAYAKAAAAAPNDLEALTGLVLVDLSAGRIVEARARVDQALKANDKNGDLLILSARVHAAAKEMDLAEEALKKAIDLDPARLRSYGMLATLFISQNRLAEAEVKFQEMIERNPNSVGINTMLGMLYETRGKIADAERQYEKVLALDGSAAVAANNLAYIYADSNRNLDVALQLAQTAQRRIPGEPNVTDTLGWVYYRKGMTAAAIRELEAAVKANGKDPLLRYHLGMAYNQAGEIGKARTTLREALQLGGFAGADEAKRTLSAIGG